MNTRNKIGKILSIAIALIMIVTSVFTGIGTAGIAEVKAADSNSSEPAGRGTDWDILYSEVRANGNGKAYPVGTRIYMDINAKVNGGDNTYFRMDTYEDAVRFGYINNEGDTDQEYAMVYCRMEFEIGNIVTLESTYKDYVEDKNIKSGGYWIFHKDDENCRGDEFYGVVASSEDEQYKNAKIPTESLDIVQTGGSSGGASGGSSTPSQDNIIKELEVNVDLTKIPSLIVGTEIDKNSPEDIPDDVFKINSIHTEGVDYCGWAVKATQNHVDKGYISQQDYEAAKQIYNSILPLGEYNGKNYIISDNDTYYCFVTIYPEDDYEFGGTSGADVSSMIKTNASDFYALKDGSCVTIYFKLGTPSEIENQKGGGSSEETITQLEVNVDWSKIPSLTVGIEIGEDGANLPKVENICKINSTQAEIYYSDWAIKMTKDHVDKGYLDKETYDDCLIYDSLAPLGVYNSNYVTSANDKYYCWIGIAAKDGYRFSDKTGENVSSILKTNVPNSFALTNEDGKTVIVFLELGTPAEIADKNGSSTGGNSNIKVDDPVIGEGAPKAELNIEKEELIKILPDDIKAAVNNGDTVDINLRVELQPVQGLTDTQKNAIADKKGDYTLTDDSYVDISLMKSVNGGAATAITDVLSGKIKVSVVVPEKLRNTDSSITRTYKLIRLHEGQLAAEEVTGTYDAATYTFTFETDRFSTYAIAYKDTKVNGGGAGGNGNSESGSDDDTDDPSDGGNTIVADNTSDTPSTGNNAGGANAGANASAGSATGTAPKTGDSSAMMMWAVIALVSLAGIVLVYRKKRA